MSLSFQWYCDEYILQKDIFDFTVENGGEIQELSNNFIQCSIQKNNEIIWIVYDSENFKSEFDIEEIKMINEKYSINPKISVVISIGINNQKERSICLAKWFCKKLLLKYPKSILNTLDKYYTADNVDILSINHNN